jgi:hypothetical protein
MYEDKDTRENLGNYVLSRLLSQFELANAQVFIDTLGLLQRKRETFSSLTFNRNRLLSLGGDNLLDVGHALLEDLLQNLGVLELLLNLGDNGGSKLLLLALLDLALVADPGVENGLGLGGQGGLLLELESLGLELGGFLGNLKQGLGDVDNTAHLLNTLNTGLDGLGVVGAGAVEDVLDLLILSLGPLLVGRASVLDEAAPDGEQADGDNGLLVDDVVLVADGVDAQGGGAAEDGRLAEQAATGKGVEDALGLLLGVLGGNIGGVADARGGQGREGTAGEDRSEGGGGA